MTNFKVGDKVKQTEKCGETKRGLEYTVFENNDGELAIGREGDYCLCTEQWELITPATKTDLNLIEEGDVLVNFDGDKFIVLGRAGRMVWLNNEREEEKYGYNVSFTIAEMIEYGWKYYTEEVKEEWPQKGDEYWYLDDEAIEWIATYQDSVTDKYRRNFLGIFKSKELARARADLIQKYVESLK